MSSRHSNCSAKGTFTTFEMSWSQEYNVRVKYKCGQTADVRWVADLTTTDILTQASTYTVEWLPCTVIPMPPIDETCR